MEGIGCGATAGREEVAAAEGDKAGVEVDVFIPVLPEEELRGPRSQLLQVLFDAHLHVCVRSSK